MALTEWVRHLSDSEEDETLNSDAAPIGKNIVNNRLRVQVGSVMNSSAPRLSKWLLDGPCRGTVERVLGITVSDMSSLSCRSCLAIAVDKIDSFLDTSIGSDFLSKSSTLSAAVHDILAGGSEDAMCSEDEVVSPVLQALLIPAADTNSSSEPECAARMIRISVLIAVCGWTPVVATTLAAAPSSSAANSAQTSSNNSPAIIKKAPSNVTVSGLETFHCNLCGRSFPFKYLFTSATPVDPLFQHRTFCQWAHADLGDAITDLINGQLHADNIPGWLQCANSLYPQRGQEVRGSTAGGAALGEKRNQSSPLSLIHNKGERCGDAEQAYKKIKLVLDMAAFPRVSKAVRYSI